MNSVIHALVLVIQTSCAYPQDPTQLSPDSWRALAAACQAQIAAHPDDIRAYKTLGSALTDVPEERLRVYESGLRIAPNDVELQLNAGLTLRMLGRLDDALVALKRAAGLDSMESDALVQAGLVAQQMKRHDDALALFRQAIRRDDRSGPTWGYMARSLFWRGQYGNAVSAWDRAERLSQHGFIDEAGDRALYEVSKARR